MKLLKLSALLLVTTLFFSCGGVNENQIVGDWNLTGFTSDGENIELTECDKQTIWSFSLGAGGDLIDGTAVKKLRSEEHTSELQSRPQLVCRLLLEKKKRTSALAEASIRHHY